jgi:hypothetical protein
MIPAIIASRPIKTNGATLDSQSMNQMIYCLKREAGPTALGFFKDL